jgi:hypothetical protein
MPHARKARQDQHLSSGVGAVVEAPQRHSRLILTDEGDVLGPDGYDASFTREVRSVLAGKAARSKSVRWLRLFLRFELTAGEDPYALLTESHETAVARCKAFLESLELVVEVNDDHLDGGYEVSHPTSIRYLRGAVTAVRQLYTRLTGGLRPNPANPMNVNGWHLMSAGERYAWSLSHQHDKKHALRNAGGRFKVVGARSSPPAMEDPSACGPDMTDALIAARVPETILDICMTMEANGARNRSVRLGNALGWSMCGFADEFMATKKFAGDALVLRLIMPDEVHRQAIARFEARPHPRRRGATFMDHLRELAALGTAKADKELASHALFPSSLGRAYSYAGFYYWFDDAIDGSVHIRTANSIRKPTSQWYRHAAISEDVRTLFLRTTNQKEREEGLQEILDEYGLSSDQTMQYAAYEYLRDGRRRQREQVERRRQKSAARRAGVPVPVEGPRLGGPGAQQAHEALPVRRKL